MAAIDGKIIVDNVYSPTAFRYIFDLYDETPLDRGLTDVWTEFTAFEIVCAYPMWLPKGCNPSSQVCDVAREIAYNFNEDVETGTICPVNSDCYLLLETE